MLEGLWALPATSERPGERHLIPVSQFAQLQNERSWVKSSLRSLINLKLYEIYVCVKGIQTLLKYAQVNILVLKQDM